MIKFTEYIHVSQVIGAATQGHNLILEIKILMVRTRIVYIKEYLYKTRNQRL